MTWVDIKKKHPALKQEVLIFCQGYDITGKKYYSDFELAVFDKNDQDRRTYAFYQVVGYKVELIGDGSTMRNVWQYHDVTHWMPLPDPPPKIDKWVYEKLAGYKYIKD